MKRALALLLVVAACSGGGGAKEKLDLPSAVRVRSVLDTYSIAYRVQDEDGKTTATLTVARPFRSRLDIKGRDSRVADFAYLATGDDLFQAAPGFAPGDVRADLLSLDRDGEVREVAGRPCQVHAFGAPLLDGKLTKGDTVDECIDASGLVLEETVRTKGKVTRHWLATAVDTDPTISTRDFRAPDAVSVPSADGGGSTRAVDPHTAPPGAFWQLDAAPTGFTLKGRYAIVPPQDARVDDPTTRPLLVAGVVDVFTRGRDAIFVEQGGTLGSVPPFGTSPDGRTVDLGSLAKVGESVATVTGAEVRALLPPGKYVKVFGSVPASTLIEVARSLHEIKGTGLSYVH